MYAKGKNCRPIGYKNVTVCLLLCKTPYDVHCFLYVSLLPTWPPMHTRSIRGPVARFPPATRETRVQFPADAYLFRPSSLFVPLPHSPFAPLSQKRGHIVFFCYHLFFVQSCAAHTTCSQFAVPPPSSTDACCIT